MVTGTVNAYELAIKHGANVAWGTDTLFAEAQTAAQGKQLAKLQPWYSAAEVLRLATSANAELLQLSGPRNPYPGCWVAWRKAPSPTSCSSTVTRWPTSISSRTRSRTSRSSSRMASSTRTLSS